MARGRLGAHYSARFGDTAFGPIGARGGGRAVLRRHGLLGPARFWAPLCSRRAPCGANPRRARCIFRRWRLVGGLHIPPVCSLSRRRSVHSRWSQGAARGRRRRTIEIAALVHFPGRTDRHAGEPLVLPSAGLPRRGAPIREQGTRRKLDRRSPPGRKTPVPPSWSTMCGLADFEIKPETPRRDRPPSRGTFAPAFW